MTTRRQYARDRERTTLPSGLGSRGCQLQGRGNSGLGGLPFPEREPSPPPGTPWTDDFTGRMCSILGPGRGEDAMRVPSSHHGAIKRTRVLSKRVRDAADRFWTSASNRCRICCRRSGTPSPPSLLASDGSRFDLQPQLKGTIPTLRNLALAREVGGRSSRGLTGSASESAPPLSDRRKRDPACYPATAVNEVLGRNHSLRQTCASPSANVPWPTLHFDPGSQRRTTAVRVDNKQS